MLGHRQGHRQGHTQAVSVCLDGGRNGLPRPVEGSSTESTAEITVFIIRFRVDHVFSAIKVDTLPASRIVSKVFFGLPTGVR